MTVVIPFPWVYDDGGRQDAGFKGDAGDCVARAIAVATGQPYREVYDRLAALAAARGKARSARSGVDRKDYDRYLRELGWMWKPTMRIGSGCTVHLAAGELPPGRLIVRVTRHVTAVIDGVIRDTYDPSREGTRCVYGYYSMGDRMSTKEEETSLALERVSAAASWRQRADLSWHEAIRAARAEGCSMRAIAGAAGLSHSRIVQILQGK